ncbi:MAG: SPOR domain-containing protein [Acetobacteraceae bacterium]|nr:SPOR domain-containing protein [Acetobacteraceae bacterium]
MIIQSPVRAAALTLILAMNGCGTATFPGTGASLPGVNVAEAALRSGASQVALQVSEGILRETPGNIAAMEIQADSLTLLGAFDNATAIFLKLLEKDPTSIRANTGLGRITLTKDPAAAEVLFLRVLKRDPQNLTALNNLGIARDLQSRHPEAQTAYRQALAIDPALTAAQVNMALSLGMSGQGAAAVQLLRPVATAPGATVKVRHDYAIVLAMAGNRAEAERVLGESLSPAEVRQVLDGVTSNTTRTARGLAPDRADINRATAQAVRTLDERIPPDVTQPVTWPAAGVRAAAAAAPPPTVVRPRLAEIQEPIAPVTQPVEPVAVAAANQRALSLPTFKEPPPIASAPPPVAAAPVVVPMPLTQPAARTVAEPERVATAGPGRVAPQGVPPPAAQVQAPPARVPVGVPVLWAAPAAAPPVVAAPPGVPPPAAQVQAPPARIPVGVPVLWAAPAAAPPVVAAPPVASAPPVVVAPPVAAAPPVVVTPPVAAAPPVVAAPPVDVAPPVVAAPPVAAAPRAVAALPTVAREPDNPTAAALTRIARRRASGAAVQFAAAPSEEAAQSFWEDLVRQYPAILGVREPLVIRFRLNGAVYWRVRTAGFETLEDARSLCTWMRASGQDCFVARS